MSTVLGNVSFLIGDFSVTLFPVIGITFQGYSEVISRAETKRNSSLKTPIFMVTTDGTGMYVELTMIGGGG